MSKIGTTEVKRIARLARIHLSDDEIAQMSVELGAIVEFVEQLSSINVDGVPPTDQVTGLVDVWREDEVKNFGNRDLLLKNAPAQQDGYIKVKRVLQ
jgi:aspartyl-tRNA(Asn)/glutamyl-tRNA(Gln) amidotransferase subunit C